MNMYAQRLKHSDMYELNQIQSIVSAKSLHDAVSMFLESPTLCKDYDFIYSSNIGSRIPALKSKIKFSNTACLNSLFNNDNIFFFNLDILHRMDLLTATNIRIGASVFIDVNVASDIDRFYKNISISKTDFKEVLDYIIHNDLDINFMPYLLETIPKLDTIRKEYVLSTIRSCLTLQNVDKAVYLKDNKLSSTLPLAKVHELAEERYQFMLKRCMTEHYPPAYHMCYGILLKVCIIGFTYPKKSTDEKLYEFVTFLDNVLCCMMPYEILFAKLYFDGNREVNEFIGVNRSGKEKILAKLKNVAFDIAIVRSQNYLLNLKDDTMDFFLPYFISFDNKFNKILDIHSIDAYAINRINKRNMPFSKKLSIENLYEDPERFSKFSEYESMVNRQSKLNSVDHKMIIKYLEQELLLKVRD